MNAAILGVVMAGGRNLRYGGLKALEPVAGQRIIDRVIAALRTVTSDVVLIANDAAAYATVPLPVRGDLQSGLGPVGGILTALTWAHERGAAGALVVACDMPFPSAALLAHIVERAQATGAAVVIPESGSRRGVEPLFAWYSVTAIGAVRDAVASDNLRMIGFHDAVQVERIEESTVRTFGEPEVLFMNVNTPEEREQAEHIAGSMHESADTAQHTSASRPRNSAETKERNADPSV